MILLEAKSYPGEMIGNGCEAKEPSLTRIRNSIERTKAWLGAEGGNWTGEYYQFANRLAHLYFLREICGVQAWLVNLCFFDDPHRPIREAVWRDSLEFPAKALGIGNVEVPFYRELFMPALDRRILHSSTVPDATPVIDFKETNKEWRFLSNEQTGRHQFLGLANARGSCSLRYFDADSGVRLAAPRYARGRNYQDVFANEVGTGVRVSGPAGVSIDFIPVDVLREMRREVGLNDDVTARAPNRSSLLSGVDEFIDKCLGVEHIGTTAPHYKHRTSHNSVAGGGEPGGIGLIRGMYSRIDRNWPQCRCRSVENWRFTPQLDVDSENASLEKQLEKAVAKHCPGWVNMVPVCSGVMPVLNEGGRRIDLIHQRGPGAFDFVELKVGKGCDTPLYASMEILGYGLIYLFSRRNATGLGYSIDNLLLSAKSVSLIVLAPAESYTAGSLHALEQQVNAGLRELIRSEDHVRIDFRFECFPEGSSWLPRTNPSSFLESRLKVYGT